MSATRTQQAFRAAGVTAGGGSQPPPPPFKLQLWQYNDPTLMAPRHWLLGNMLLRGEMTTIGAAGGTGKTAIAIACGLACITGQKEIVGLRVFRPAKVAFLTLEDDRKELERRIAAAMYAHGVSPADIAGKLYIYSARERSFLLAYADEYGVFQRADDADALLSEISANNIGLVIIDPLVKSHGAIENSNEHMDKLASLIIDIATRTGAAILVLCHNRKGGETGRDAIRGGSSLVDAARINRTAAGMTEEIARAFGLQPEDAARFVGLHDVKSNMAPHSDVTWFELRSMPLGNVSVNPIYPAGDHVHAAVQWEPPSTFDGLSLAIIKGIFDAIRAGPELGEFYTPTRQANDWVGDLIVKHGKTPDAAAHIVKAWLDNGVLVRGEYSSPKRKRKTTSKVTVVDAKAAEILAPLHGVTP